VSGSVGVSAVIDVENLDFMVVLVDAVVDSIFASACSPQSVERCAQGCADASWAVP
jgi:hypothetical protein